MALGHAGHTRKVRRGPARVKPVGEAAARGSPCMRGHGSRLQARQCFKYETLTKCPPMRRGTPQRTAELPPAPTLAAPARAPLPDSWLGSALAQYSASRGLRPDRPQRKALKAGGRSDSLERGWPLPKAGQRGVEAAHQALANQTETLGAGLSGHQKPLQGRRGSAFWARRCGVGRSRVSAAWTHTWTWHTPPSALAQNSHRIRQQGLPRTQGPALA